MRYLVKRWHTLPVVLRAVASGITVAAAGTSPWAGLVSANVRHSARVPWAVPVTAAYLTIYWLYFVRGAGWPASTGASRRAAARANSIDEEAWGVALLAGISVWSAFFFFRAS